ncbi:hypothetical protein RvY_10980, partial [Ramazzottius varieornatus]
LHSAKIVGETAEILYCITSKSTYVTRHVLTKMRMEMLTSIDRKQEVRERHVFARNLCGFLHGGILILHAACAVCKPIPHKRRSVPTLHDIRNVATKAGGYSKTTKCDVAGTQEASRKCDTTKSASSKSAGRRLR